jgi:hypothetical protein
MKAAALSAVLIGWLATGTSFADAGPMIALSALPTSNVQQACATRPESDTTEDFCVGYVLGVFDALAINRVICPPPSGSLTMQAVAIARLFLAAHPELWDRVPSSLLQRAYTAAFPCP